MCICAQVANIYVGYFVRTLLPYATKFQVIYTMVEEWVPDYFISQMKI